MIILYIHFKAFKNSIEWMKNLLKENIYYKFENNTNNEILNTLNWIEVG